MIFINIRSSVGSLWVPSAEDASIVYKPKDNSWQLAETTQNTENFTCSNNSDCGGALRGFCDHENRCKCLDHFGGPKCTYCVENRYTPDCVLSCDETTDCSGHGRCSWVDAACMCFHGWSGSNCNLHNQNTSNQTGPPPQSCKPPPKEICCTHLWSNSTPSLLISFRAPAFLSSLTLWNPDPIGKPLLSTDTELSSLAISLNSPGTVAGCQISSIGTAAVLPLAAGPASTGPFAYRSVECGGGPAASALVSLPRLARPALIAARICVVIAGSGRAAADLGPSALWVQLAPNGDGGAAPLS